MLTSYIKFPIFSIIITCLILLNFFSWENFWFGGILGFIYLLFNGFLLAQGFFPKNSKPFKIFYGFLFIICLIAVVGALIYYTYELNNKAVLTLLIALPIFSYLIYYVKMSLATVEKHAQIVKKETNLLKNKFKLLILFGCYVFFYVLSHFYLFRAATDKAILSPWEVVNPHFFITFFISTFILITFIAKSKHHFSSLILILFHALQIFSIGFIIYKLGYGFDPFIHQATEQIIKDQGFIYPKPLYYLGQYSLVVILSKLFFIPVVWLDKLLVIVLAALYLPATVYYSLTRSLDLNRNYSLIASIGIFILPFSSFILTTPQSFANLLSIIIIFLSLIYFTKKAVPLSLLFFLGLTTLAIHPLAGVPISIFLMLILLMQKIQLSEKKDWLRKLALGEFIFFACLILPAIFLLNSYISSGSFNLEINFEILRQPWKIFELFDFNGIYFLNRFNMLKDLVYFYGFNITFFSLIMVFSGFWFIKQKQQIVKFLPYIITFFVLLINFLLLKSFLVFKSLIEYERHDFSDRVLEISYYFLLPFIAYFIYTAAKKLFESHFTFRLGFTILLAMLITFSTYLTYPRNDNYVGNHGYNVSAGDIEAVHYIEDNSQGRDYFVLANQTTSVTALKEFGFKKYYGINFYYPIPTSTPLYQYYLNMVYEPGPTEEHAEQAMEFMQVDLMYLVVNEYWYRSDKIIDLAKHTADEWVAMDNNRIYIFKYTSSVSADDNER